MDEYITTVLEDYICHFKNEKPHREIGPAVYLKKDESKYSNLSDKDLYKNGELTNKNSVEMIFFCLIYVEVHHLTII